MLLQALKNEKLSVFFLIIWVVFLICELFDSTAIFAFTDQGITFNLFDASLTLLTFGLLCWEIRDIFREYKKLKQDSLNTIEA